MEVPALADDAHGRASRRRPAPGRVGSTSTLPAGRRVEPKATSVAVSRCSSVDGPPEELLVLRVGLRVAALDPAHAEPVELLGDPELVLDGERDALELGAVAQRRVEDLDRPLGAPAGSRSASPTQLHPVLVLVDLAAHDPAVLLGDGRGHRAGARDLAVVDGVDRATPRRRCRTTNISSAT